VPDLAGRLSGMAGLAESLPIGSIEEFRPVTAMRFDMVNLGGLNHEAQFAAIAAGDMPREEGTPAIFPSTGGIQLDACLSLATELCPRTSSSLFV